MLSIDDKLNVFYSLGCHSSLAGTLQRVIMMPQVNVRSKFPKIKKSMTLCDGHITTSQFSFLRDVAM